MTSLWPAIPGLLLLAIPLVTLLLVTPWQGFRLAYGDGNAVATSLGLSSVSLAMILLLGIPLAFWLARSHSRWRFWAEGMVMVPLLTPPLALGILLVSAYGPYSSIGEGLYKSVFL